MIHWIGGNNNITLEMKMIQINEIFEMLNPEIIIIENFICYWKWKLLFNHLNGAGLSVGLDLEDHFCYYWWVFHKDQNNERSVFGIFEKSTIL